MPLVLFHRMLFMDVLLYLYEILGSLDFHRSSLKLRRGIGVVGI